MYERLYKEFKTRWMTTPKDFTEWNQYLTQETQKLYRGLASYRAWVEAGSQRPRPLNISLSVLAKLISSANWKLGNYSARRLNSVLLNTRYNSAQPVQGLDWRCGEFRLGLKVHGRPLTPRTTEEHTADFYGADLVNPGFVLGMRYTRVGDLSKRDVLVAPLGNSLSPTDSVSTNIVTSQQDSSSSHA